jgi:exosortase
MMENARSKSARLPLALPYVAMLVMLGILYLNTFSWWWFEWTYPGSFYAHAVFVPFFVMVMIWRNREALNLAGGLPSWSGLALLLPGLALLLISERSGVVTIQSISFDLALLGITMMILGTARTRLLLFPIVFIIMMMPLVPDQLINSIAFPIQITSARLATMLLNALTLHSVCEGTQIHMEHYTMAVELPCSGFKTLVSLLTFSAAFAYLVEAPLWKRWTLFLTTAPLSLIINGLRIAFIGIVGELFSTHAAATFHDYSGFIVLILAFTFLFNFARLLKCERFLGIPLNEEAEKQEAQRLEDAPAGDPEPAWWQLILAWRPTVSQLRVRLPFILAIDAVLLCALAVKPIVVQKRVADPPIATFQVPKSFVSNGVTYTVPPTMEIDRLSKEVQEALNPTRIINRDYAGSDGSRIQFFLTAGNGRKVFHDPHTCSIGSDAVLSDVGTVDIPTARGTIRVLESRFKRTGQPGEQEFMFCYFVEGKNVQRTEQVRNKMIAQMLFGDSGQPSYFFRCIQEVPGVEPQKRQQLINFITGMYAQIGDILTGKQHGQPDAPPIPSTRE